MDRCFVLCVAYGAISLAWLVDYGRRLRNGASREEMRRALAGGVAAYLAFVAAAHTLLFWHLAAATPL